NLRKNAYQHIGSCLRRLLRPSQKAAERASAREGRIYWLYGLLAGAYSAWLIGFILVALGGFLMARYQGWGAAFFTALVIMIFRGPIRNVRRVLASLFIGSHAIIERMKRIGRLAIFAAIAAAALYFIKTDFTISG